MQREKIYLRRMEKFLLELKELRYTKTGDLTVSYIYHQNIPIPYAEALTADYKNITLNELWGELWGCAWFKFKGQINNEHTGKKIGALIDIDGEGCVVKDGIPFVGLTNKIHWDLRSAKSFVPLFEKLEKDEEIEILVEAGANGLFGAGQTDYRLKQADLVVVNPMHEKLYYDFMVLGDLAQTLPEKTVRRNKILWGLNQVMNIWQDGKGLDKALEITGNLLSKHVNASSTTAYSIGHAHIDLAWLWPVRETKRKGERTFATVLQLMKEYPEYKFGASQPQLYQWMKEDYPELYQQIKQAAKDGKWECQGAMWVEPDMNLAGGEALIRQCFYGKQFFKKEFDQNVKHLWLPDVFGYSAALPQILKKCGVDMFMTQKISWNETNLFPHYTFYWEGIDGTKILTHFLPTNDYNLANTPKLMIESELRYTQSDVSDEFLNLYGIGDGGGGPSREHIELGLRQQNLEGTPKFKFAFAEEFFDKIRAIDPKILPHWSGELYLELHRGTYTTQALMKKYNRMLENKLHDLEFLGTLIKDFPQDKLDQIWKDTLLNQFHDILPGSSITWVYKDAHALSEKNLKLAEELQNGFLTKLHGENDPENNKYVVYNTLPWSRIELITLPKPDGSYKIEIQDEIIFTESKDGNISFQIHLPSYGYTSFEVTQIKDKLSGDTSDIKCNSLSNHELLIELDAQGAITRIYDKEAKRDVLKGKANLLYLYEDKPNNWGAWDINHFYQETIPQEAELLQSRVVEHNEFTSAIIQELTIGNSLITQIIRLETGTKQITISHKVDWKEKHKMLRVLAMPDIKAADATCEIQYGMLKRSTHDNTSWEQAKFEVPAHKFVDISQPDYGFALLNDCKYGHSITEGVLGLSLLRAPADTDPEADIRVHEYKYAYYPHTGDLTKSDVLEKAHNLNHPVIIKSVQALPEIEKKSYFWVEGKNVKIETIKPAYKKSGIIIRVYETMGSNTIINIHSEQRLFEVVETDMLEYEIGDIACEDNKFQLEFKPFEIRTLKLRVES